jgi:hypothetical protein
MNQIHLAVNVTGLYYGMMRMRWDKGTPASSLDEPDTCCAHRAPTAHGHLTYHVVLTFKIITSFQSFRQEHCDKTKGRHRIIRGDDHVKKCAPQKTYHQVLRKAFFL